MSQFSNISFEFESMPHKFGGFSIGDQIIINSTLSVEQQFQWLSEEISHHEPSIVDISDYQPTINARQEAAARNWVYRQSLTYRQLEEI